jgi:hypothetical protein
MKFFFLVLIFIQGVSQADDYYQFVKPVKIKSILDYTRFQLHQNMDAFFKTATSLVRLSDHQLLLQADLFCRDPNIKANTVELQVLQSPIVTGPQGQEIRESLILKACNTQIEIFSLERHSQIIQATPIENLLKGEIPDQFSSEIYKLNMMDRKIKFDFSQNSKNQKMDLSFLQIGHDNEIQMQIFENYQETLLNEQFIKFTYLTGSTITENHEAQYIWNLDQKTNVPRQYLYYRQAEVVPRDFLLVMDKLYNKAVFPLIARSLQLFTKPL